MSAQTDDGDLPRLVFEAIGEASMCWKPDTGSAVFDSTKATDVAERLIAAVRALYAAAPPAAGDGT